MSVMHVAEITERVQEVLRQHLQSVDDNQVFPMDTALIELGLDSLRAVDLLLSLEDTFGIIFPDAMLTEDTFRTATTLRDAIQSVCSDSLPVRDSL